MTQAIRKRITFAELIVPKTTAYVGEMIPIVVRVGFELQTRVRNIAPEIDLPGQGFTKQKMRASEGRQMIGGKTYNIVTYKTAIAAARTGTIEIGPVEVPAVVLVPQSTRNRPFPQNPLNMNDPLDSFFNDPWLMGSVPREVKLRTERVNIEVKALPPNAPPSFGGAVGNFTMIGDANPKSVQVGDPITVTAKISGRGNFDRVTGPSFEDEKGWHKYPPSADFKQDDDVGISGAKTFETVLSPNERKDKIPAQLFTYFDSLKEQYVTLRTDPIPVRVEGGAAPATAATRACGCGNGARAGRGSLCCSQAAGHPSSVYRSPGRAPVVYAPLCPPFVLARPALRAADAAGLCRLENAPGAPGQPRSAASRGLAA